ncbi:MAG: polyprenol monophosphomannose synthase, partial [Nanoarchaeota archaeon]
MRRKRKLSLRYKMRAVIIVPTYNEAENILLLLKQLINIKVKGFVIKILVVDDNSPDQTGKIVEEFNNNKVFLLNNLDKAGLGNAYLKGMDYAVQKLKADILIEMDADFSHNPNDIPMLLSKITQGYDLVIGSRYVKGGGIPNNWSIHRKLISYFGNIFIGFMLSNNKIKDWSSGFRAIKKTVFEKVKPDIKEDMFQGYTFQVGFLYYAHKMRFRISESPIIFSERKRGISKF